MELPLKRPRDPVDRGRKPSDPLRKHLVSQHSRSEERPPQKRRTYEPPSVRLIELDVMSRFPDNCKMDVGSGGFGGAAGSCQQSSQPGVMCLSIGS